MSAPALDLVVDPAPPAAGPSSFQAFGPDSEWSRALAGLCRLDCPIDPVLLLDLHAYEVIERVREIVATRSGRVEVTVPFWPRACHGAAGIAAHPARELEALLPPFRAIRCVMRPVSAFAEAQPRVFGSPLFDPARYAAALEGFAAPEGWLVTAVEGSPLLEAPPRPRGGPVRETASGLIVRGGRILLERRSADAKSYPGYWDTPGGHLEPGESARDCLERELREELALADVHARLVARQDDDDPAAGGSYLHHVYLIESFSGDPQAREGQSLGWWEPSLLAGASAPERLNPLVAWLVREGLARAWLA